MLLPTEQLEEEKIAKTVATIALHNFHWHYATLVLFNSTLICSVDIFLSSYKKNVIVGRGTFYPDFVKKTRQYIIFGTDLPNIVHILNWMRKHQFDNTGKYIVVCKSELWDECNEVDLVNILWNYKIINVVLVSYREGKTLNGLTYYQPEDCMKTQPTKLKNWNSCFLKDQKYCQNMYPLKLNNLYGCPIIVSTFNQVPYMKINDNEPTGVDGDLLRVIAHTMNISLVLMTPRIGSGWGKVEDNGTWSGSLADVYNEWANFSMTSGCITISRYTTFQISTDYAVITIGWVTHPSEVQPQSLKLLRPFQIYVRIVLAISFVMVVLFKISLRSKFSSSLDLNSKFRDNFVFNLWQLCMGIPVTYFPTNKALLCLAVFWIWYCFLIRTLYQVCLINSLQTDIYTPEFDTIEEAIASKYTFGGGLPLRDYYIDNAPIFDAWENVESTDVPPTMVKLSRGLRFVMAMNIETTKMFLSSNPDKELHILPRIIAKSPTAIFFKKYSPLVTSLNIIFSRLRESGIIQKIYKNNTGKKYLKNTLDNNMPITMIHYTGCYMILLTGWFLSGLCFIVEKLVSKKNCL